MPVLLLVFFVLDKAGQSSVNTIDLQAPTLVGPPQANPGSDPLAVKHLYNRPFITL